MKNECLAAALQELSLAGVRHVERAYGGKHALIKFTADGNTEGMVVTLDLLKEAGWSETLLRVSGRIGASLRSNFPPAEGPLSRTAARLLRGLRKTERPN